MANLTQPHVGISDDQMCLLFQITAGEVGWGRGGNQLGKGGGHCFQITTLTPATTVLVKRHLEFYIYGVTI